MTDPISDHLPVIPGFQLLEEIGRGSTSRVYRAHQVALDREVAVKVTTALGAEGGRRALRLFREARLAGALDHPGVVRGIDAGESDGACWFAMELVDGESLAETLERDHRWSLPDTLALAEDLLEVLDHVHRRGVVHRDIKPANILMDVDGRARLLDLGLARRRLDPTVTHDGTVGTPQYMSPEQATNPRDVDGRSDLFSFGATLYRTLCGEAPFDGQTVGEVLTNVLHRDPPLPSSKLEGLPQSVDLVLQRLLEKRPERRYQTAGAALSDIRAIRATGTAPRGARQRLRWPLLGAAMAALAAVLIWWGSTQTSVETSPPSMSHPSSAKESSEHDPVDTRARPPASSDESLPLHVRLRRASAANSADVTTSPAAPALIGELRREYLAAAGALTEARRGQAMERLAADEVFVMSPTSLRRHVVDELGDCGDPATMARVQRICEAAVDTYQAALGERRRAIFDRAVDGIMNFVASNDGPFLGDAEVVAELDRLESQAGPASLLSAEQRAILDHHRLRTRRDHSTAPLRRWAGAMPQIDELIAASRLRTARQMLRSEFDLVRGRVPHADEEARSLERLMDTRIEEHKRHLASLEAHLVRPGRAALSSAERAQRIDQLRTGLRGLPGPNELPETAEDVSALSELAALLAVVADLRARTLAALGADGISREIQFSPLPRGAAPQGRRWLVAVRDHVIEARDEHGTIRSYDFHALLAPTVCHFAEAIGLAVPASAAPWLAYLDGDDAVALKLVAAEEPRCRSADLLERLARARLATWAGSFEHAADRQASHDLLRAEELVRVGDEEAAEATLQSLKRRLRESGRGWSRRPFWTAHGATAEALFDRLRAEREVRAAWRAFAGFFRLRPGRGELELALPLDARTAKLPSVALPPGATVASDGVRLPALPGDVTTPPDEAPSLEIRLPSLASGAFDLSFDVRFDESSYPPGYLSIRLHDVSFLLMDSALDGRGGLRVPAGPPPLNDAFIGCAA